jgi:hypothetical protein
MHVRALNPHYFPQQSPYEPAIQSSLFIGSSGGGMKESLRRHKAVNNLINHIYT